MREASPKIVRTKAGLSHYKNNITLINSKGFIYKDSKERGRVYLMCIAAEGNKMETGFAGPGASAGFEYFQNQIDIDKLAKENTESALMILTKKK